jgi:cupin fold WbuC family metalloprotein
MNLIKDKKSKSKSYYLGNKFFVFSNKIILNKLKKLSNNFQYQARICLHRKKSDKLHQMIIYQPKNLNKIIKKHPKKDKSYFLLDGEQIIEIYNSKKKIIKKILLNKNQNFFYLKKNIFHSNYARSKHSIHIESISGPFNRKTDRVYG